VKVVIKKREEASYLVSPGVWTTDILQAKEFKSLLSILDYRREHKLEKVEALFCFQEAKYNFALKIS